MMRNVLMVLILWSGIAVAAETSKHVQLIAITHIGEKQTQMMVDKDEKGITVKLHTSDGEKRSNTLSDANFAEIMKEFKKLPVPKKIPDSCASSRVDIAVVGLQKEVVHKASCLGVKSITEPEYAKFVNTLVMAN
jgi:hypothetical protein